MMFFAAAGARRGLKKSVFSVKYMDTDALTQAAPVAISPHPHSDYDLRAPLKWEEP